MLSYRPRGVFEALKKGSQAFEYFVVVPDELSHGREPASLNLCNEMMQLVELHLHVDQGRGADPLAKADDSHVVRLVVVDEGLELLELLRGDEDPGAGRLARPRHPPTDAQLPVLAADQIPEEDPLRIG